MRLNYWQSQDGQETEDGINVTHAKQLLKEKGGHDL